MRTEERFNQRAKKLSQSLNEIDNKLHEFKSCLDYFRLSRVQYDLTLNGLKLDTGNLELF